LRRNLEGSGAVEQQPPTCTLVNGMGGRRRRKGRGGGGGLDGTKIKAKERTG
jgi:hypothetical protein